MNPRDARNRLALQIALGLSLAVVSPAHAQSATFALLLDSDRSSSTGCQASTVDGMVSGIEVRLLTSIDTLTEQVTEVSWAACIDAQSNSFGPETAVIGAHQQPPWQAVVGEGSSGSTLIETLLPRSAVPSVSTVDAYVDFTGVAGSDALVSPGGGALPTGIPLTLRSPHVPSLSSWGLVALLLSVGATATMLARRPERRSAWVVLLLLSGVASPIAVRAALGDGVLLAWKTEQQVASDFAGDAPEGVDILALFAEQNDTENILYVRLDVLLGPAICLPWPTVDPGDNFSCYQEPPPDPPGFGNAIAMTFDDGPSTITTPSILATLRAENIPATFFMKGNRLETSAEQAIALEIHNDPLFRVANHSYSHPRFTTISLAEAETQVSSTSDLLRAAIGDPCYFPRYFRFPFGASNCDTVEIVREHGMTVTGVNINTLDWCYASGNGFCSAASVPWLPTQYRDDMAAWILFRASLSQGGIMLMHDIHANTAAELPALITQLRAAGAFFIDLAEPQTFPLLNGEINPPAPPACCNGVIN